MAGLLCPLHLLHHVCVSGVDYYCPLSPPRHLFGLRLVFPFEYLQRLHDSMIGPALVQPWVLHDPWAYEPSHAMPYPKVHLLLHWFWSPLLPSFLGYAPFFCICLGIYYAFISGFASFLGTCVGISRLQFGFYWDPSALVLVPLFAFISVPDCFFCLGLGPFFNGCFGL